MNLEILTKEDLQVFRLQLINDLKALLLSKQDIKKEWLRSNEVRKLLKISPGTLQNLRITGKIKSSKIGGINYYRYTEIENLLDFNIDLSKRKPSSGV